VGSLDFLSWSPAGGADLQADGAKLNGVAASDGVLVGVGSVGLDDNESDAAVWTSQSGSAWTRVPDTDAVLGGAGSQVMNVVLAVNGRFLALGKNQGQAAAWTSDDGTRWTPITSEALAESGSVINDASVASDGTVIAVGFELDGSSGLDVAAVWSSDDGGTTWNVENAPTSSTELVHLRAVAIGPEDQVVVGGFDGTKDDHDGAIWTSDALVTWTRTSSATQGGPFAAEGDQEVGGITPGPHGYVAVGEDKRTGDYDAVEWSSADGTAWERSTSADLGGADDQRLISVLRTASGLMAVGYADEGGAQDGAVWISDNGAAWTRLPDAFDTGGEEIMRALTCMDDRIVVVGKDSDQGAAWTADGATC
jgi:hypothetical protein